LADHQRRFTMNDLHLQIEAAENKIRPLIRRTPLIESKVISETTGIDVFLKLENLQYTGSFKTRGAVNALLSLSSDERKRGITTASTGNHALAVAYGLSQLGLRGTIYLPENALPQKIDLLKRYHAPLSFHGGDCEETERYARAAAEQNEQVYISPYNNLNVMAGQGTIALELLEQKPDIDCILASVGGGGLIGGIAGYTKALNRSIEIIGCLPQNSPTMYEAVKAGQIVDTTVLPTLSDATAGGLEAGTVTFDPCRRLVDEWVLVEEAEIKAGLKLLFETEHLVVEGAAGVAVAALLKLNRRLQGKKVALVICGGNVDIEKYKELVF